MDVFKRNYVRYGLLMSAVVALCLLLTELTGQNESFDKSPFQIIFMTIAPFIIWFLGIRAKKKEQGNKLTFKQGLVEGIKISFVYGVVSPFVFLIYYLLINPGILDYVKTAYGLTSSPTWVAIALDMFVQFVASMIFGTLYGAIISFFLKTKSK